MNLFIYKRVNPAQIGAITSAPVDRDLHGGYLRTNDPPPGNMVIWRGWARLNHIMLGTTITTETYG